MGLLLLGWAVIQQPVLALVPLLLVAFSLAALEVKHQRDTLYKGNESLVYCEPIEEDN